MKPRYTQAFTTDHELAIVHYPSLRLIVDDSYRRLILTVTGPIPGDLPSYLATPLVMDRDEAWGFEEWLCRALTSFPTTSYRSFYTLRMGRLIGVETHDGRSFGILAGKWLADAWEFEWDVRASVSRTDIDALTNALAALRPSAPGRY